MFAAKGLLPSAVMRVPWGGAAMGEIKPFKLDPWGLHEQVV